MTISRIGPDESVLFALPHSETDNSNDVIATELRLPDSESGEVQAGGPSIRVMRFGGQIESAVLCATSDTPPAEAGAAEPTEPASTCSRCVPDYSWVPYTYQQTMLSAVSYFLARQAAASAPAAFRGRQGLHVFEVGTGAGTTSGHVVQMSGGTRVAVDTVDVDPAVTAVASKCMGFEEVKAGGGVRTHLGDARELLQQLPDASTSVVMVDAFDNKNSEVMCLSNTDWAALVRRKLRPSGAVVINTWRTGPALDRYAASYFQSFTNGWLGTAPGLLNRLLVFQDEQATLPGDAEFVQALEDAAWAGAADSSAAQHEADVVAWWRAAHFTQLEAAHYRNNTVIAPYTQPCSK